MRCRDGCVRTLRPGEIIRDLGAGREAVAPAWPRPEFDVATYELLIGLFTLACPPRDQRDWITRLKTPPSVEELDAAVAPYVHAFNLEGDGPLFLQDFEALEGEPTPIERLLIDAAGENSAKKNKDVLVHRDRYRAFGAAAAAIALYALQQFAPSGGAGNRTSMRGGGPMTALVWPPSEEPDGPSLWARVWANTPLSPDGPVAAADLPKALPWLAPTRTSEKGRTVEPDDAHPAQAFFGTPRRMRLAAAAEGGACDLTSTPSDRLFTGFVQRPYGVNYGQWEHPLTPHYRQKEAAELLPTHPKPGRFGYRDWTAVVAGDAPGVLRKPAGSIENFIRKRVHDLPVRRGARLFVAGFAMSNMEPLDFMTAEQPLHIGDPETQEALGDLARRMAKAGDEANGALRYALKWAAFGRESKADMTAVRFDDARLAFFDATEDAFHRILAAAAAGPREDEKAELEWLGALSQTARRLFEGWALKAFNDPIRDGERVVEARSYLLGALYGTPKKAPLHDALGLPHPKVKKKKDGK